MVVGSARIHRTIRFGEDFELDVRNFQLRRGDRTLKLERIPLEILALLIERAGQLVTRDEIVERIWGKNVFLDTDNSINSAVRKVRQALQDDSEEPKFVQTVVGRGYLFIASQLKVDPTPSSGTVEDSTITRSPLIGCRVGDYRILQLIGAGGMGVVYKAEDLKLGRQVAIKFLPAELTNNTGALERMQREARIASTIDHPNICPIYQLGEFESQPFIVLPLLEGGTLREWIAAHGARPADGCVREILNLGIQIGQGLKAAHDKGIVHRDIKPANIFLTTGGEVKILDFGVAEILNAADATGSSTSAPTTPPTTATATHVELSPGTPAYLSPEQINGGTVDERSDLFSFGSVLYEIATGRRAFQGESVSAIHEAIVNTEAPPIRSWKPGLPDKLDEIVRKALEKDRERRYRRASDICADLSALKAELDLRTNSEPKPVPAKSSAASTTRRAVLILIGVAVLALAALWIVMRADPQPFREFTITQITNTGRAEQAAISPDGKYVLHVHDENGMKSLRLRNIATGSDTEILLPVSTRFRSLAFSPDGNYVYFRQLINSVGSEWDQFRMPVLGGKPEQVARDVDSDIIFSPDGSRISYVRANDPEEAKYRVLAANLDGSHENVLTVQKISGFGNDAYPPFAAWSPDGKQIAYTFAKMADEPGVVRLLNLASGQLGTLQHFPDLFTFDIRWLPGKKWLLLAHSPRGSESEPTQISAFSLADRKLLPVTRDANSYSSLSLSADGKVAAAVQTKFLASLDILNVDSHGARIRTDTIAGKLNNIDLFDWIDNDHLLATDGAKLLRIDTTTGKATELLTDTDGAIVGLAQCSTGYIIVNRELRTGSASSEIWRVNEDGSRLTRLSEGRYDMSPACSPDGKSVFYLDGMQRLERVPVTGGKPEAVGGTIANFDRVFGTFGFSPDGNSMVALVDVVDPSSNRAQARLAIFDRRGDSQSQPRLLQPDPRINAGSLHSGGVRYSPDGKSLVYAIKAKGVGNLWVQPLDGSPGHALTSYTSDTISHFRFSPDGKTLIIRRTHTISDIVVLHDSGH